MPEPRVDRPQMPGYGVPDTVDGALPWSWALERIAKVRTHFISSVRPDGRVHVMPVWGIWTDGWYVFSTAITSVKSKNLMANPSVGVSFEDGMDAFVLEGTAEIIPLDTVPEFVELYKEKYDYTIEEGPVWGVRPRVAFAFIGDDSFASTATAWRWS
jgi:hypothetical protein